VVIGVGKLGLIGLNFSPTEYAGTPCVTVSSEFN
jgi:hypothetical protein